MWFRSVFVVMPRVRAISAVLAPVDRARSTSSSRSVRRARRTLDGLPLVRVARAFGIAIRWRVPCANELAASQKSSGVASLATYPLAPACSADCTESALSNMVSTPIGTCGASARMARIASTPPIPGIRRSIRIRSGRKRPAAAIPSAPSDAWPTTWKRPSACKICTMPSLTPDVILMDLKMPKLDGVEATRRLRAEHPEIKVLILSTFDADSYVLQALRAGASGYVLKDSQPDAIVSSIMAVISGERVMANAVANRVLDLLSGTATPKEFYDGLTGREIEILKLLATGLANKQIARRLGISEKTVRNHVSHMYEKLQIYDRSQAVLYAVRKGLVEP